jgi:hypothetical protein
VLADGWIRLDIPRAMRSEERRHVCRSRRPADQSRIVVIIVHLHDGTKSNFFFDLAKNILK